LNVSAFVGSAENEHMMGMFFKNVAEFKYYGNDTSKSELHTWRN
jgi:hypothetical protein